MHKQGNEIDICLRKHDIISRRNLNIEDAFAFSSIPVARCPIVLLTPFFVNRTFLVRIVYGTDLYHTICVDTKRGPILDSSERYLLILTSKKLFFCAGGDHMRSGIAEVWKLVDSPMSKKQGIKENKTLN